MRDEYITGNESYTEIGARYGVTKSAIEQHSGRNGVNKGKSWGELRQEFRDDLSRVSKERVIDAVSTTLVRVKAKAAAVAELALDRLSKKLSGKVEMEDKDLVAVAKLATAVKVELAGDPDQPISIKQNLDALTVEQLRKLASG
jgi:hypothetical protein